MEHQDLREKLARVARQMIETGLLTETSGNISPRTPEGDILVTPSGIDYEILDPEDVVLVDVQGKILDGALEPTGEILMHTGVHRARSRAGAVVYTHSRYATTLACLGWEIPPVHYMLTMLSDDRRIP